MSIVKRWPFRESLLYMKYLLISCGFRLNNNLFSNLIGHILSDADAGMASTQPLSAAASASVSQEWSHSITGEDLAFYLL